MAKHGQPKNTFYEDLTHEQKAYIHANHNKEFVLQMGRALNLQPFRIYRYMDKVALPPFDPTKENFKAAQAGPYFNVDAICRSGGTVGEYSWIV